MTLADFGSTKRWIRDELAAGSQDGTVNVSSVATHPHGECVACTVTVKKHPTDAGSSRLAVIDLVRGQCDVIPLDAAAVASPAWSPDGAHLAVIVTETEAGLPTLRVLTAATPTPDQSFELRVRHELPAVDGAIESVAWSPDSSQLAFVVAPIGAEVSDVYGSGTIPSATQPEWWPKVLPAPPERRRVVHTWRLGADAVVPHALDLNAWDASWIGNQALVVLGSPRASEGAWYSAELSTVNLSGSVEPLYSTGKQMAQPSGSPSGDRWTVLVGHASDRGLLAGALLVGHADGQTICDTNGVDVTDHRWVDDHRILYTGSRCAETVFGLYDLSAGSATELLATDGTSGRHQPELGGLSSRGDLVVVLERHDRPPELIQIRDQETRVVLSTAGPGTAYVTSRTGTTSTHGWSSTDGLAIHGLLTVPAGSGPFPLIVNIHGGPVAAWHNGWIARDPYTTVLVSRGYAVLRPNPRGSTGRGDEFVAAVIGDMGGRDVDDITTAVHDLVERGIADARRIGITGNSYGGYMSAWVPSRTDLFAAAVARSPVTEWVSQHFTSNLAEFDLSFVGGSPTDRTSNYTMRSPMHAHRDIRTPMLLTAGARDLATPAFQAEMLHGALARAGVPTQLAIYPQEGHGVHGEDALVDQLARMVHWFDVYLRGDDHPT